MSDFVTLASNLEFPEGPSVATDGSIWVSELRAGRIARIGTDREVTRFTTGGAPNGTAFGPDGALWFCDAERGEVRRLDPATGSVATVVQGIAGEPLAAPNDLAFHPDGSLLFTCPGNSRVEPTGYICRRDPDGHVGRVAEGLLFPNGVCLSHGGDRVLVAETYAARVVAGPWAAPLSLCPLVETPGPIGADGVAVAPEGSVFTCVYGAGLVLAADGAGRIVAAIPVPDRHPAGCAIDPFGRWRLLVTGAETGVLLGLAA